MLSTLLFFNMVLIAGFTAYAYSAADEQVKAQEAWLGFLGMLGLSVLFWAIVGAGITIGLALA